MEIKTKNFTGVNYLLNQYFIVVDEGSISMAGIFHYYFVTKRWWIQVPYCIILSFIMVFSCDQLESSEHTDTAVES